MSPDRIVRLFPLWALLFAGAGYLAPETFAAFKPAIIPLLGLVMFGMGVTLTPADFVRALRRPGTIALGTVLQYGIMPAAAWLVAVALDLPPMLLAGMVLVGASPGGTASNVIVFLARGDVALSITLTTVSTLLAVLLTPWLTLLYAGQTVPVPALDMLISIAKIILLPVMAGVLANHFLGGVMDPARRLAPLVSVAAIALIIAIVVALNVDRLLEVGAILLLAVVLHNLIGLACGYWGARLLGADGRIARTLAIEVGMQNSGLAVALGAKYFGPLAALPGAVFSVWHNLSGSVLASLWGRQADRQ